MNLIHAGFNILKRLNVIYGISSNITGCRSNLNSLVCYI